MFLVDKQVNNATRHEVRNNLRLFRSANSDTRSRQRKCVSRGPLQTPQRSPVMQT